MADCMMFPKDWRNFLKDYSFIDSEQVYTNGSELIQVFRVIQLIEHLLKEQEPVKPIYRMEVLETHSGKLYRVYSCGKCNAEFRERYNFCPICGQAVKWND